MRNPLRSIYTPALLVLALAAPLGAQGSGSSTPSRIAIALAGCWEPATGESPGATTCVVPEDGGATLRVISLAFGREPMESRLRLNGERWPVAAEGCQGWQQAQVSTDGERILIAGEMRCGTLPAQRRSATFLITPRGEWLRAEGRGIASIGPAQVQLMRVAQTFSGVSDETRGAIAPLISDAEQERMRLQRSRVTSADLIEFESRGASSSIIDVVVAAGNPKAFVLDAAGAPIVAVAPTEEGDPNTLLRPTPGYGFGYGNPYLSYYDYAYLSSCSMYGYGAFYDPRMCSMYAYSAYRYGGGYGGAYGGWYGGGWWPGYYPGGVVVINPIDRPESGGRVVRGQGYRNAGTAGTARTATPRSVSTGTSSSGSSRSPTSTSSGSSSSGSSSSGSGSSSSSGGRTAQPRSP